MIRERVNEVLGRIAAACARAGRDPSGVTLVAVSKQRTAAEVREVLEAGVRCVGESRVQEAREKVAALADVAGVSWQLIGHLQTNKVRQAVELFDCIQSVDSLRLAACIDREAARINKVQQIFLEVKTSGEDSKAGIKPEEIEEVLKTCAGFHNSKVAGLMTIAPYGTPGEAARPYFRKLRELRDKLSSAGDSHTKRDSHLQLSMGMTDDFEAAIAEGATMVRVGRAIFEGADL